MLNKLETKLLNLKQNCCSEEWALQYVIKAKRDRPLVDIARRIVKPFDWYNQNEIP